MKRMMMMMIAAVAALCLSANGFAQDQRMHIRGGNADESQQQSGWMEKMKAARVAFLTNELDLSAKEAEAFWPVYNQAQAEKDAAYKETRAAYKALNDAIKENKGDKEIEKLLKAYLQASKVPAQLDDEYLPEYLKVLPAGKVAKLYISEEKFRKMQFQNHRQGAPGQGGPGQPGPGMRDGKGPRPGFGQGQRGKQPQNQTAENE